MLLCCKGSETEEKIDNCPFRSRRQNTPETQCTRNWREKKAEHIAQNIRKMGKEINLCDQHFQKLTVGYGSWLDDRYRM